MTAAVLVRRRYADSADRRAQPQERTALGRDAGFVGRGETRAVAQLAAPVFGAVAGLAAILARHGYTCAVARRAPTLLLTPDRLTAVVVGAGLALASQGRAMSQPLAVGRGHAVRRRARDTLPVARAAPAFLSTYPDRLAVFVGARSADAVDHTAISIVDAPTRLMTVPVRAHHAGRASLRAHTVVHAVVGVNARGVALGRRTDGRCRRRRIGRALAASGEDRDASEESEQAQSNGHGRIVVPFPTAAQPEAVSAGGCPHGGAGTTSSITGCVHAAWPASLITTARTYPSVPSIG